MCYIFRVSTSSSRCLHFNSRAYTKQRQTGFIHFTTTWTHGLIFFDHHYCNPNSLLQYQPTTALSALYRWCLSLPGFLFFGHCVSYFKLQLFLFSYKSVSVLYRSSSHAKANSLYNMMRMSFQHLSIFHVFHGPSVLRNSFTPLQFYQSIHGFFYITLSALLFPFPIFLILLLLSSTVHRRRHFSLRILF